MSVASQQWPSTTRQRAIAWACAAVLLGAFVAQCVAFARANAQTYDEAITLAAGYRILRDHRDDVNAEHPPLAKMIAALPVWLTSSPRLDVDASRSRGEGSFALGREFLYSSGVPHERLLGLGRAPMIALSTSLVALIGWWAFRLWGARAGLLALGLAAFDPDLVAHGSLIGHDAPLALFATCAFFCTSELFETRRVRWLVLAGVAVGLALVTKFSGVVVVVAVCGAMIARAAIAADLRAWWSPNVGDRRSIALLAALGNIALLVGVALVVVRCTLGASGYAPYFDGMRAQLAHQSHGHPAYFLGAIARTGWVGYFPFAIAVKEPPLTLALFLASLVLATRGASPSRALCSIGVPFAASFAALLLVKVDIGVRYALPLVPLIVVLAARVATIAAPTWIRGCLVIAVIHHAVAAVRVAPHDLAFFSDVVGGPSRGHRYLSDSNLDWGQDLSTLGAWLAKRERPRRLYLAYFGTAVPEAYGVDHRPAPSSCAHNAPWDATRAADGPAAGRELLAISTMTAQGIFFDDPRAYAWLEARRPIAVLGWSISVYDITDDADAHRALARLYDRYGPRDFADDERARAGVSPF